MARAHRSRADPAAPTAPRPGAPAGRDIPGGRGRNGPGTDAGADAPEEAPQRLHYYTAGFLRQKRVRRILELSGYAPRAGGWPGADGLVAVWGHSRHAARGEAVAARHGAGILRVEDAFLRSLHPARRGGEPPLGLVLDRLGCHFDGSRPSGLEQLLKTHPLDNSALLARARALTARMQEAQLSKYAADDPGLAPPAPGYVLVLDQLRGDASVRLSGADANTFREMLYWAQEDHPGARIVIRTHPAATGRGRMAGHYDAACAADAPDGRITLLDAPVSLWALMEGAVAVYTVSSQAGFDAILAGHRPRVFGRPFYAGWGLSDDRHPLPPGPARRDRSLTRAQLTAGAMLLYPKWYDPFHDRLCDAEEAAEALAARARAWREDRAGWRAEGMRLWKRPHLQAFFGQERRVRFAPAPRGPDATRAPAAPADAAGERDTAPASAGRSGHGPGPRRRMAWGPARAGAVGVEDGFLRSRGLGADLVPPLSLALDELGMYYDPSRESRLERLIAARAELRPDQRDRAEALITRLVAGALTKYNLGPGGTPPALPPRRHGARRILVAGQVEDDASVRLGAGTIRRNAELLAAARRVEPRAVILYKPHPDVARGLRPGALPERAALVHADAVLPGTGDAVALLDQVDAVWTMTSLIGFEALLRGVEVICTGRPFYAGWGLTRDLDGAPGRRQARVDLAGLVHAALVDYPRYLDPVTGTPCPVEVAVDRLTCGPLPAPGTGLRLLAKAQGLLASRPGLWR